MIQVFRIIYVLLIGSLVFYMFRRGGCCGGHGHQHHHHRSNRGRDDYDINKSRKVINDDEKNNAIDI